jgi:hypothetical protein
MRFIFFIFFIFSWHGSRCQDTNGYKFGEKDTILLTEFKAGKVIAYKVSYVTFYFNLQECEKDFSFFWRNYEDNIKQLKKDRKRGKPDDDPEYNRRAMVMDSVHTILQNKSDRDTVFLTEIIFKQAGLRGFDIEKYIDEGKCAVADSNNKMHYLIIRQKLSYYKGPLNAWGGKRYFLPGYDNYFYQAIDWIS